MPISNMIYSCSLPLSRIFPFEAATFLYTFMSSFQRMLQLKLTEFSPYVRTLIEIVGCA